MNCTVISFQKTGGARHPWGPMDATPMHPPDTILKLIEKLFRLKWRHFIEKLTILFNIMQLQYKLVKWHNCCRDSCSGLEIVSFILESGTLPACPFTDWIFTVLDVVKCIFIYCICLFDSILLLINIYLYSCTSITNLYLCENYIS